MYKRYLRLPEKPKQSFFLWGPRQTGKTTLLKACYLDALRIDLLKTDELMRYMKAPSLVCLEKKMRKTDEDIYIAPYQEFTRLLWDGKWTQHL